MDAFLRDEKVDLVCATDLTKKEMVSRMSFFFLQNPSCLSSSACKMVVEGCYQTQQWLISLIFC